jgi:DNA-binding transcriptional MerR regulator
VTIGELARRTGISVRTLHYYEELGLLRPLQRTPKGHRLYGDAELLQLQQILSLRALGLPLEEVRSLLTRKDTTALETVERHLERVRAEVSDRTRLLRTLESVAARLRQGEKPTAEQLLRTIEETNMLDKYYTKEQLETLAQRHEQLGPERIRQSAEDWKQVISTVREAKAKGLAPTDPSLRPTAEKWISLIREFSGGDRAIESSLETMYKSERSLGVQYGIEPSMEAFIGEMLRTVGWKR